LVDGGKMSKTIILFFFIGCFICSQQPLLSMNKKKSLRDRYIDVLATTDWDEKVAKLKALFYELGADDLQKRDRRGFSILHYAVMCDDRLLFDYILQNYPNTNINVPGGKKKWMYTPLILAVKENNLFFVDYLLKKGAGFNIGDRNWNTPLHWAAENGFHEVAVLLLNKGATISLRNIAEKSAKDVAKVNKYDSESVKAGKKKILQYIEKIGKKEKRQKDREKVLKPIIKTFEKCIRPITQKIEESTKKKLFSFIEKSKTDEFKKVFLSLLKKLGSNILDIENDQGESLISKAVVHNVAEIVKFILSQEYGCPVHKYIDEKNKNIESNLMLVVKSPVPEEIQGEFVKKKDIFVLLIKSGSRVGVQKDSDDRNFLHHAAINGFLEIVEFLRKYKGGPSLAKEFEFVYAKNLKDKYEKTPFDYAKEGWDTAKKGNERDKVVRFKKIMNFVELD